MNIAELSAGRWRARLALVSDPDENDFAAHLTPGEREAMDALPTARRRSEWAAARIGIKHLMLQDGVSPQECEIHRIDGRPAVRVRGETRANFVSISHSRWVAVAAIAPVPVGVDLQDVRPIAERAAKFFLDGSETALLHSLSLDARLIHLWTAKEAAWKASAGSNALLKSVELSLERESESGLWLGYETAGARGSVETERIDGGFVLALALERRS